MSIVVSVLTGGSGSHQTTSEEANAPYTDFVSEGVVGAVANTSGVAPATGGFSVNAQGSPDATVAVAAGVAYVTGTPTSQNSQTFRVKNSASANVTINANSSGSTKYDWIYIKLDATNLNTPNTAGDNVATLVASRSSSASADDGTPPTYGYALAVVTVANGFSTITNGNIADKRVSAEVSGSAGADLFVKGQFDFIESGCVWTADNAGTNRNASMTSGIVWIAGKKLTVAAVTARTFTASKDTYVDLTDNGDGTAAFTYVEATNNDPSSALTASGVRNAIIVTGATTIATAASINQGQEDRVLPIASSIPYQVTDSLGNMICPRDPERKVLGQRQIIANGTSTSGSGAALTTSPITVPFIAPSGRKVIAEFYSYGVSNSLASGNFGVQIWSGSVGGGSQIQSAQLSNDVGGSTSANLIVPVKMETPAITPSAGSNTYNIGAFTSAGTITVRAGSTNPGYLRIRLV